MAASTAAALLSATSGATDFLQKNVRWIGLALFALALWWLFRPYFSRLFGLIPEDAKLLAGGGDVTAQFYEQRKNVARRLHDSLTGNALLSEGRCEALYDALQWNANELRLIHNTYKNAYGETLLDAASATYTDDCGWFGLNEGLNSALMEKLNALQLT
ncbi:MAG: hypothetical protein KDD14_19695 [Saprospiraceae bacterium]|nr:hypothetical protein [Saprospiraceae bacterium]